MKNKHNIRVFFICVFLVQLCDFLDSIPIEKFPNRETYLIVLLTLCLALACASIKLYQIAWQALRDAKMDAELSALKEQNHLQQEQAASIADRQRETLFLQRALDEDLQHFRQLLEEKEYEKASEYLNEITNTFQKKRFRSICQNSLISAILESKRELAVRNGIKMEYEILLPESLSIGPADLSSLFFNLLDNGIESCLRSGRAEAFVHFSVSFAADFLTVRMVNSKNQDEKFDHHTVKKDDQEHGLGLYIIEDICKKNDGLYEWKDKGDAFESVVLLRCAAAARADWRG
ncbi:sensor histidine kinase [Ruminococcus sp. 5_1_39BFAA]|uniref:sensor histidine kinase n=1 Tax=Ruminococcus sp. 5_1_39BFAA TaxID=457412 RepID=UPI00356A276B